MALCLGVFAPAPVSQAPFRNFRSGESQDNPDARPSHSDETPARTLTQATERALSSEKYRKYLPSKVIGTNRRIRPDSNPVKASEKGPLKQRPESTPARLSKTFPSSNIQGVQTPLRAKEATRAKHIPIIIPDYEPIAPPSSIFRPSSFSTTLVGGCNFLYASGSTGLTSAARRRPRHVEIKIPDWAQPFLKRPKNPLRSNLNKPILLDPLASIAPVSPPDLSEHSPKSNHVNRMGPPAHGASPNAFYINATNSGSHAYLSSANSSQSSLGGRPEDDESASEAESQNDDHDGSHTPSQGPGQTPDTVLPGKQNTPGTSTANLSGLVCNVHRTTGKEPHPLVGASTTVLGDKLYVFGGRRLSRTRPQLTSHLYELDLIKRHWTKLVVRGDVPTPRYFHSVCTLGDSKLVCYGGMSPAPLDSDLTGDDQPEVAVMSDIHIYDVPNRTWMKVNCAESPQGRYAHCAAILPSSAVFASTSAPLSAVHLNPSNGNPNQGTLGVSLDGTGGAEMVVVGGQDSANHYIEQVSVFNLRSLKWTGTTGMGRSCGAYRSVVAAVTSMTGSQIGAGPHAQSDLDEEDDDADTIESGAPMLIYSNYNFLDVKLELQVRLTNGQLTEKPMHPTVTPPGLRFPNGGVIANHFVVSGTFLTTTKQEYALWALDLRTLTWSRIDAGGSIFSQGSWNRGVLWSRRNSFIVLGNRKRSLVDDYNNRRINFSNICIVELEAFGLYDNPRRSQPSSSYVSASSNPHQANINISASGRQLSHAAEALGALSMNTRELADMDLLAIDGTRIPVNSRLISRRWGRHFTDLLRDSLAVVSDSDASTLRPTQAGNPSRNSSITITPSVNSTTTTLTANNFADLPDARSAPPSSRPRLFYLPHTPSTLQALLHFLYTSTLLPPPSPLATPQVLCSLLQLARPYKIDGLLEAVVERLHESLDGRNAAAIFNAAAMAAGGGEGVQFFPRASARESVIPIRTASLAAIDSTSNGVARSAASLRIDTEVANSRSARNTLRPGQSLTEDSEDDMPSSAATDTSMSDIEASSSAHVLAGNGGKDREVWDGAWSAVVGLQKRGLRGLMEGRKMRERGKGDEAETKVGLGIA